MKLSHIIGGVGLIAGTVLVAPAANAAAPDNDGYAGRIAVGALPASISVDTTEATTDADDAALNADCGAPATDASVWYSFTPGADGNYLVGLDADYSAGVLVASGGPGSWHVESCGPGGTTFSGTTGTEYSVLVFDDQEDGAGNGGHVTINVQEAPPTPTIDIAVDPKAKFNADGSITLTGTATCTGGAFAEVDADVTQIVGRTKIRGYGYTEVLCDDAAHPFSMQVTSDNGIFKGGKAASVSFGYACGDFDCGVDYDETTVMVSGGAKRR